MQLIKEFEASHGTVADLWHDHLDGKETSLNPLGMVEAIIGVRAISYQYNARQLLVGHVSLNSIHKIVCSAFFRIRLCNTQHR